MFKLIRLDFADHPFFGDLTINFTDPDEIDAINYVSFIIGPNGTGKSKILLSVISIFNALHLYNTNRSRSFSFDYRFSIFYKYNGLIHEYRYDGYDLWVDGDRYLVPAEQHFPDKILISSFSFNDKYPLREQRGKVVNPRYHYLGLKSTTNNIFLGNPTKTAVSNLYQALAGFKDITPLRNAFNILGLSPRIELIYGKGKYFNFLQQIVDDDIGILNTASFRDVFNDVFRQRQVRRTPELKRLGNEKVERLLADGPKVNLACEFIEDQLINLTTVNRKEIGVRPVLNFGTANAQADFDRSILPMQFLSDLEILSFQRLEISKQNSEFSFDDASSGEYHIIISFLNILSQLEENSVVMLDEPEISLHPNWQIRYMDIFKSVFSAFPNTHFIIASHSHFLVSDLKGSNSSIIAITQAETGQINVRNLLRDTFGWSAEQILLDVFNVASTRNYYLTRIVGDILEQVSRPDTDLVNVREQIRNLRRFDITTLNDNDPMKMVIRKLLERVGEN